MHGSFMNLKLLLLKSSQQLKTNEYEWMKIKIKISKKWEQVTYSIEISGNHNICWKAISLRPPCYWLHLLNAFLKIIIISNISSFFLLCICLSFFLYSKLVSVHLALILFSQAGIHPQSALLPPKWWKSILTRDQDLYDRQRLQLQAHQTHLNGRQKQRDFCPLCLLLKIPLKICSCLLQSAL